MINFHIYVSPLKGSFNQSINHLHIPMFDKESMDRFHSPQTQELVEAFKAYDYIGFQRGDDVRKFISNAYQQLDVDGYKLCWNPVGIDLEKYQTYQPQPGDDKIRFIFAGRYDYIKGHIGFLNSIYGLLEQKLLDATKIEVLFIGGESRGDIKEYRDYQNQIKQLINKINKKYKCIQELGKIPRESLGQLLSSAENQYKSGGRQIVMCPSIMDGQNLIVHEAIAASPYNIIISSEGSGCIEVVGRDNIFYLKQHDINNYKIVITEAIKISMEKQIRRNCNAIERLQGQFNSSKWLSNIISNLNRKTFIFDIDGTISDLVNNPNDAQIHEEFFEFINLTHHNVIMLTGREYSNGQNLTAKNMLMNKNLKILSSHGLLLTNNYQTLEHPLVKQIKPMVLKIHQEVEAIMKSEYMRKKNVIIEKKLLGVTINLSLESKEAQVKIFSIFRSMFRKQLYKQPFVVADEHCSIEIRPNIGKLEGFKYFIENELTNEQVIFICDSLGTGGTDLELAQYLTSQGQQVWQVKNNQPDYLYARKKFDTPKDLCQYMLFNVMHL